ncbi:LD-carboxypeptidase [Apilactobacillus timberlakei]|uniref:S66 family peptidase n=1 Tax=Apilactobacillus timberlakei TaxID=2008380 RepID=UPI00112AE1E0|nr:LD-carboxypeptidase [Apilactobacillus timberlakei]TPR19830.1 LD-carboxypeptidase [Apilactobacillus timberlakei]TPR21368.1 LD-carboxypeptidase [Apilactobacillus timberlakei]TPR23402.1 LD-carboxypeptidase [Apilactobacillus timberlakei]
MAYNFIKKEISSLKYIFPKPLKEGDEIRIIAPSDSLKRVGGYKANLGSKHKLEKMGFKVTFGDHINECDVANSSPIKSRVSDLHAAFKDKKVKAILSVIGGFTSNELLPYIDYDLIKHNPKIICGFSDFTALANAITVKTGLITFYGPAYASLKMSGKVGTYQDSYFKKMLTTPQNLTLHASKYWQSGPWYEENANLSLHDNSWKIYNHGIVEGRTVGGNFDTFGLLMGTNYQPELNNNIILFEFSEGQDWSEMSRHLAAILQASTNPKALLIGRFPVESNMSEEKLFYVLNKFPILKQIPVMYDVNFGHAQPIFTIPIGGIVTIDTHKEEIIVHKILK